MVAPPDSRNFPAFPARVGRYELLLPLGTGGTACVYLARDTGVGGFERDVALKLMHPHLRDPERVVELFEEAKLTARIRHHHVVPVLDVGDDPEGVFLVMEYVEGGPLSDVLRGAAETGRPFPPSIAVRVICDALSGLHAAHELTGDDGQPLGLVHRDFSPQNILVGVDGVARLTDFGIAKARSREGFTGEGLIKGKIGYLSPEQARGAPIDRRSDVWSAAVVAWELLAGRRMFPKGEEMATLLRIVEGPAPRLRTAWPDAPAEVDEVVAVGLSQSADRRWGTALELRARLLSAFGAVADTPEVAEFTRDALKTRLAERRERLEETLRFRPREDTATAAMAPLVSAATSGATPVARPGVRLAQIGALIGLVCVGGAALAVRRTGAPLPSAVTAATVITAPESPVPPPSALPSEVAVVPAPQPASDAPKVRATTHGPRPPARSRHASAPAPADPRLPTPLGNPYSSGP